MDEFDEWLLLLRGEPEFDMDPENLGERMRAVLREIYDAHGFIAGNDYRSVILERRWAYAQNALPKVIADPPAGTAWRNSPKTSLEKSFSAPGFLGVAVHGNEVYGLDPVEMLVEVAAHLQEDYIDEFFQVWPVCSRRGTALRPVAKTGGGHWWCKVGDHDIAEIGRLEG